MLLIHCQTLLVRYAWLVAGDNAIKFRGSASVFELCNAHTGRFGLKAISRLHSVGVCATFADGRRYCADWRLAPTASYHQLQSTLVGRCVPSITSSTVNKVVYGFRRTPSVKTSTCGIYVCCWLDTFVPVTHHCPDMSGWNIRIVNGVVRFPRTSTEHSGIMSPCQLIRMDGRRSI